MAEQSKNELEIEANRQIIRYLAKASGKDGIDAMDKLNSSTVLHNACEYLCDLTVVETIVSASADVNAVNEDNDLPLTIIKRRREKDMENETLEDIEWYLEKNGGVDNWKNIPR
jgi:ankyrin repeat protein|tara:strand:- start:144 stop:485 length:342 start_codon:yes stop_codon:yes gene_type:complete